MKSLLLLDDDHAQLDYLASILETDYKITKCRNAIEAWNNFNTINYDGCIIDVHMPIISGLEFIQQIREKKTQNHCSFFLLSSDTSNITKIQALNLGIKDFLWPDMSKEEISVRIKNNLHAEKNCPKLAVKTYKDLSVDILKLMAYINSSKLELTLIEFKLLNQLLLAPNTIISRDELKQLIWPEVFVLDKTLNTHLTNLRLKISKSEVEIKSVKNEGIILS